MLRSQVWASSFVSGEREPDQLSFWNDKLWFPETWISPICKPNSCGGQEWSGWRRMHQGHLSLEDSGLGEKISFEKESWEMHLDSEAL